MSQQQARLNFIKHNPGKRIQGYSGWWYNCANCGKLCGRPGKERANIPEHMKMEVDHIKPWSQGGSDEVWNLQPLCKPCNRAKSANPSLNDQLNIIKNNIIHGDIIKGTVKKAIRQNKVLKIFGLNNRK